MYIANRIAHPFYFEATGTGLPFYEHVGGFEKLTHVGVVHKTDVAGAEEDVKVPLMVRTPGKGKGAKFEKCVDEGYPAPTSYSAEADPGPQISKHIKFAEQ
ncbi:hypothetical protein F4818DRAFT_313769 [Hypoxylon cercidicola]|nr:hypothetical protein F4818DRAFT_313769 [Hypoxylon cercidicola]